VGSTGTPEAPARPDESSSQRRTERRWPPLAGVLALIAFVTLGARGIGAVSVTGPPVGFQGILLVHPQPGWTERARSEEDGSHQLLLTKGAARLSIFAIEDTPWTPPELALDYARSLSTELSEFATDPPTAVTLASGGSALRFGFVGVTTDGIAVQGEVTASVTDRAVALVFEVQAQPGDLGWALDDTERMIDETEVL